MEKNLSKYWDNIHLIYNSEYDGWLDKYIEFLKKKDIILELGCGRAYCSKYLHNNNYYNVIASDFSKEVLKIVNKDNPNIKTMLIDIKNTLPFKNETVNTVIADLCLHYFDNSTTLQILKEIYRILKKDGYLIARVNSVNDLLHIPKNYEKIEENFYYDGEIYKRFFSKEDFELLFQQFEILNLEEKQMDRYVKRKILWEFCIKK